MTGEDVLSEKKVLEKAATIKNIELFPLRSELKKQIDIEKKKRYQKLYKVQGLNKIVLDEKRENSHLVYKNFNFNKLRITGEKFRELSDDTKYKHLQKVLKK